jgi:hypothetical protein
MEVRARVRQVLVRPPEVGPEVNGRHATLRAYTPKLRERVGGAYRDAMIGNLGGELERSSNPVRSYSLSY